MEIEGMPIRLEGILLIAEDIEYYGTGGLRNYDDLKVRVNHHMLKKKLMFTDTIYQKKSII